MADNLLLPVTLDRILDSNGDPVSGAKVNVYDAGTTDAKSVWTDDDLTSAAANPIVADSGGYLPARYIGTGAYKLVITDADDVTIKTEDNLPGALDTSSFLTDAAVTAFQVVAKTAAYTVVSGDQNKVIAANPTGGAFAVTLPNATSVGDGWSVTVKHTGSANAVTVDTTASQTIDGESSFVLYFYGEAATFVSDGANWHVAWDGRAVGATLGVSMVNGILDTSVGASALTVSVKTLAGNDPSAGDPVYLIFRSATLANGGYVRRVLTAATSVTVSSGSTLGASNSSPLRLWVTAHDDDGTIYLGVSNRRTSTGIAPLNVAAQVSTSAEGGAGGADSAGTIYTSSAVTSKAMAILGYLDWPSGLSTAGAWASAPTTEHLFGPGSKLPGDVVQFQYARDGAAATGTTALPFDNTTPQNTEGDERMTLAITPTATMNILNIQHTGLYATNATGGDNIGLALFQDSNADALAATNDITGTNSSPVSISLGHQMVAGTVSETTFKIRAGDSSGSTVAINALADGSGRWNGLSASEITITEYMG